MNTRLPSRIMQASPSTRATIALEFVTFGAVYTLITLTALHLDGSGMVRVDRAFAMMGFGTAVAAAILLGLAAWLSSSGRATRVALAVAVFSVVFLLTTIELDAAASGWADAPAHLTFAVTLGLLASALRRHDVERRAWHVAIGIAGLVAVTTTAVVLTRFDVLGDRFHDVVSAAIDAVGVAVAVALVLSGVAGDRPLLRRVGLAFGAVSIGGLVPLLVGGGAGIAQPLVTSISELVGVIVLLLTAVPFASSAVSALWSQHEEWQSQLAEAEAAAEDSARRDHEMRNLLLGLAGATNAIGARIESPTGRHLHAAASAELQRLRVMLDDRPDVLPAVLPRVPVGTVLNDLAAVHRAGGADVLVRATGPLCAVIDPRSLAQIVTNLLVNCARHAPGAPVELCAIVRGPLIRVEVVDRGPGLPPGIDPDDLLRAGVRGSSSRGQGFGLDISAELVRRWGGSLWLTSTVPGPGCTAVLELVAAADVRVTEPIHG